MRSTLPLKDLTQNATALLCSLILFLAVVWVAGYNFDGTWSDSFANDHPENFTRTVFGK